MALFTAKLHEVKFKERFVIVKDSEEIQNDYDIIVDDPEDNAQYCIALLNKLQNLRLPSFRESFVDYQCEVASAPRDWLEALEKLIAKNIDFFYEVKREFLLLPFYGLITNRLANYPTTVTENLNNKSTPSELVPNPYDIEKTKMYLEGIWDLNERSKYLDRLKTDYQQLKPNLQPTPYLPFDEQVKLELAHLKLLIRYGHQPVFDKAVGKYIQKLTVVGNVTILAVALRKLLEHKGDNNKPYLSINPANFILFLTRILQTPEGKPLDKETLIKNIFPSGNKTKKTISKYLEHEFLDTIPKEHFYATDLDVVKQVLEDLSDYKDRLIFLNRVLTNFTQRQLLDADEPLFVRQMKLEIKHQKKERKRQKGQLKKDNGLPDSIKLNGRVNVLMTFFFDLMETFPNKYDVVLIDNSKSDIIHFVEKYFRRKGGEKLSAHSLRTMLTPSKWDKRCSADKQIDLSDCLDIEW